MMIRTASLRPALVASLAVLALAACNKPEPAAPEAPATAPVATAPAESPPTVDANALTAEGLGPLKIGMTLAEVVAASGADSQPNAVGGADPAACDEFHPARAPEGVTVMIEQGVLTRISLIRDAAIKTDRGFGVGSQGTAIKAAYGGGVIAQPAKYDPAPAEDLFVWARGGSTSYVTDATARGVRYEVGTDGLVKAVRAGGPSIQLVEGCS
ncbi:hypothetical protein BH10PSE1_BH10PSE1_16450 [soil metagenome]